jgi:L-lysine exporter family protein LysE/ArgO
VLQSFVEGFLLGFGAALPLGPINILIVNNALKSYKAGVALGLGAMSADILYLFLILAGTTGLIHNPAILNIIGIFGSLFLLYLAYIIYKSKEKILKVQTIRVQIKNLFKIYSQGFILTLFNPMTIAFWFSITGYGSSRDLNMGFTILGLISAITLWITIMPYLVHRSKQKISQRASKYLNTISAFILFGFAIFLFTDVVFL